MNEIQENKDRDRDMCAFAMRFQCDFATLGQVELSSSSFGSVLRDADSVKQGDLFFRTCWFHSQRLAHLKKKVPHQLYERVLRNIQIDDFSLNKF